uniref:Uncharacterized protein n=1 Tax=viral metagenome TaxID=1070528 RepID=A0A6M3IXA6_9ZZZZ
MIRYGYSTEELKNFGTVCAIISFLDKKTIKRIIRWCEFLQLHPLKRGSK